MCHTQHTVHAVCWYWYQVPCLMVYGIHLWLYLRRVYGTTYNYVRYLPTVRTVASDARGRSPSSIDQTHKQSAISNHDNIIILQSNTKMMMGCRQHLGLLLAAVFTLTAAQDYQPDYQDYADSYENQDDLYANYAMKQNQKVEG